MPKVLRIINRLNLGGPTYNASYLSRYIDERYETLLVTGMKDDTEASSEYIPASMGLSPKYIKQMHRSINPFKDRKAYAEIDQIIKEYKPDIVHTHAAKAGALGRLVAHRNKVPVIVHTFHGHVFHSYFNPIKTRLFLEIERYLARISTKIIAISEVQKQELVEQFRVAEASKVAIVPLGFDLSRFQENIEEKRVKFRSDYNLDDDEIAIGLIGRMVPIKNHPLFIEAIHQLAQQTQKKVRAFIVGDGETMMDMRSFATKLGVKFATSDFQSSKDLLTFTSWIKDVDYVLAGLDVVALTSFNEGTPVSLIEAQAANKPIVSTAVGGISDVVMENETALLSPSDDVRSFTQNLLKLVEDDELRVNTGKRGYEHVHYKYSYQRLVDDTAKLYDQLLGTAYVSRS